MAETAELVIIGGGPAGYAAALRARERGLKPLLVERALLGGTCVHAGCIPTITLLETMHILSTARAGDQRGLPGELRPERDRIGAFRAGVVSWLAAGIEYQLRTGGIQKVDGSARLTGPHTVAIAESSGGVRTVQAERIVLATGSIFQLPRIPGIDGAGVWTTDATLEVPEPPARLVVLGGNFIAIEWANIFQTLGSEVTLVEAGPQLLPGEDAEIAEVVQFLLEQQGIQVRVGATVTAIESAQGEQIVQTDGGAIAAERVLIGDCRVPATAGLGLEAAGVQTEPHSGAVLVDQFLATSQPHIWAAGDLAGGRMLAIDALEGGKAAAENATGGRTRWRPDRLPRTYHTAPEVAAVGLTEAEARAQGLSVKVGRADLGANARAQTLGEKLGMVKVVSESRYGEILGVHVVGPRATEMIAPAVLALQLEASVADLARVAQGHPTLAEALPEAARAAL